MIESLEHLEALLEDVRQLIERQTSLQQASGPVSRSLLICLKSCEKSIDPLRNLIERYHQSQSLDHGFPAKLRRDISIGLKTKDILELERAVDREIDRLSTALIVNGTNIQYVPFHLVQSQTRILTTTRFSLIHHSCRSASHRFAQHARRSLSSSRNDESQTESLDPSTATLGRRTSNVQLQLAWFDLSKQRTTWHARRKHYGRQCTTIEQEPEASSEAILYYWAFHILGFGLRWSQHRQAGRITPSLSVCSIVEVFDTSVYTNIQQDSAKKFQQLMSSGEIHPFIRNSKGESLLHVSRDPRTPPEDTTDDT